MAKLVIKEKIANKANYGGKRNTKDIKWIVVHYTAVDGDTDDNEGTAFQNHIVQASAHYFVDSDSVTRSVPDDYVAYSVGGNKYPSCHVTGGGKYYGQCTNFNSLSIEICDDNKNGVVYPSEQTIANAIELTRQKMKEYNIPPERVIRHFDVNGKLCPMYWCASPEKDKEWQQVFHDNLVLKASRFKTGKYRLNKKLKLRKSPKFTAPSDRTLKKGSVVNISKVSGNWGYIESLNRWIALTQCTRLVFKIGRYKLTRKLKVRKGASLDSEVITTLKKNTKIDITQVQGEFGYVQECKGWIALKWCNNI